MSTFFFVMGWVWFGCMSLGIIIVIIRLAAGKDLSEFGKGGTILIPGALAWWFASYYWTWMGW